MQGALLTLILLTSQGAIPFEPALVDAVDLVELNHYYDDCGRLVFDQLIFYDWCPYELRYQVRAWRLVKKTSHLPVKDRRTGEYVICWWDGKLLREVRAKSFVETWTQYDPEMRERKQLQKDLRKGLLAPTYQPPGGELFED